MFVTGFFCRQLLYYITSLSFCQPLFRSFFKTFFEMKYPLFFYYLLPSPTNAIPIGLLFQCSPSTALLLYHSFSPLSSRRLSRVFNRVLWKFTKWRLFQQKATLKSAAIQSASYLYCTIYKTLPSVYNITNSQSQIPIYFSFRMTIIQFALPKTVSPVPVQTEYLGE